MFFMKSVRPRSSQSGYVLLALMLTMTLILIALSVEAPRIAQQIKREKEEELVHRGKDYATAVKRFVHKSGGRYPVSVEQLESTNHIRFLRKKYVDPMTGDSDWKMVHVGEAEIKIPAPQNQAGTLQTSAPPQSSPSGNLNTGGGGTTGGVGTGSGGLGGTQGGGTGNLGTLPTNGIGNGQTVGGGQIMGVASVSKKHSIKEFNDKDEYDQWYFVYDLRLEQSGGTGVTVAAPRGGSAATGSSGPSGGSGSSGANGSAGSTAPSGTPDSNGPQNPPQPGQPTPTPSPSPSPAPN
jgi:type II secretory pathway pseudopilin PulG